MKIVVKSVVRDWTGVKILFVNQQAFFKKKASSTFVIFSQTFN